MGVLGFYYLEKFVKYTAGVQGGAFIAWEDGNGRKMTNFKNTHFVVFTRGPPFWLILENTFTHLLHNPFLFDPFVEDFYPQYCFRI